MDDVRLEAFGGPHDGALLPRESGQLVGCIDLFLYPLNAPPGAGRHHVYRLEVDPTARWVWVGQFNPRTGGTLPRVLPSGQ